MRFIFVEIHREDIGVGGLSVPALSPLREMSVTARQVGHEQRRSSGKILRLEDSSESHDDVISIYIFLP